MERSLASRVRRTTRKTRSICAEGGRREWSALRGCVAANGEGRADLELANGSRAVAFKHWGDDVHGGDDHREQIDEEPARFAVPSKELSRLHDPPHAFDVRGNGHYAKAHDDHIHRKDHVEDPIHHEEPVYGLWWRQEGNLEWRENGDE